MTASTSTLSLDQSQLSIFLTHLRSQLAMVGDLQQLAAARKNDCLLIGPGDRPLASCSPEGLAHLHTPLALRSRPLLGLIARTQEATYYIGPDQTVVELERNQRLRLCITSERPSPVELVSPTRCSPLMLSLATAVEQLLGYNWPCGLYRAGRQLLYSTGAARLHTWNSERERFERFTRPPLHARRLTPPETRRLPEVVTSAAGALRQAATAAD